MANIIYSGGSQIVTGTQSNDTISPLAFSDGNGGIAFTSGGTDTLFGLAGSDVLSGGDSNDRLFGGSSNDTLNGDNGNDTLFGGTGSDTMRGGAGDDVISVEVGFSDFGTDKISGGTGFDTIAFQTGIVTEQFFSSPTATVQQSSTGVFVNLVNQFVPGFVGTAPQLGGGLADFGSFLSSPRGEIRDENGTTSVFADVEQFNLTAFTDVFHDSSASHIINGNGGNDYISGGGGADTIDGGTGNDTAVYSGSTSAVSISLLDFGSGGNGSGGDANGDRLFGIENVFGSGHGDFMLGDGNANILRGFNGNDTLLGGNGTDTVDGGEGDDFLRGGSGNDTVNGGAGSDTAEFLDWNGFTSAFLSPIRGTITLGEGTASTSATLIRTNFNDLNAGFTTTLETDTLISIENVNGSDHSETITGNSLANILNGDGGNDTIDGGRGSDTLNGGEGVDTASFIAGNGFLFTSVNASLTTGIATVSRTTFSINGPITVTETDTLSGFENLTSGAGTDRLTGNSGNNVLNGGAGGDTLAGLGGADTLIGGEGTDTADYSASLSSVKVNLGLGFASSGDAQGDTLQSIENVNGSEQGDNLFGSDGVNVINGNGGNDFIEGGAGADTLNGGAGVNTLSYEGSAGVLVSLSGAFAATGDAAGDVTSNFQNISGSVTGDDFLIGDEANNALFGNGGADILIGGIGGDLLNGGEGFDTASYTGPGTITIDLAQGIAEGKAAGDVYISIEAFHGGDGADTMRGDAGDNTFSGFGGNNTLIGRAGNDTLIGGSNEDQLEGGGNDDTLLGGGQNDVLEGNAGADQLSGGDGLDTLIGGTGDDTMDGGAGADTFVFTGLNAGQDTITDFQDGIDLIRFNSNAVDSFADLAIAGNGTDHLVIIYGTESIDVFGVNPITLTAADFAIL